MYEDKTLVCKECGNEFVFTAGEQEFYAEKGFAVRPARMLPRQVASSLIPSALSAAVPREFLSNPWRVRATTVANALPKEKLMRNNFI